MQLYNYLKDKMPIVAALGVLFGLSSCGSYQLAGYDDDIYGTSERRVEYQEQRTDRDVEQSNNTYYQNYFAEKSQQFDAMVEDSEIFTDIDSYEGSYAENDSLQFNPQGFAGWGQANDNITINVYDNGWNNWGWGLNNWGWGWNNWGWGWNNWGWNGYWGWNRWNRWNRWGWGWRGGAYLPGWGFGYGFYDPWYGYAWNGGYYYGNRYRGRSLAYNAGRRGSYLNRNLSTNRIGTSTISRRNSNYTRSSNTRVTRDYRLNNRRRNTNGNSTGITRPRRSGNGTGVQSTPRRRPSSGTRVNQTRRSNSNSVRRSNTRSNNSSFSRSSSPGRSSGVSRSSSSRSSGRTSSPSRSSSRRNN